MEFSQYFHKKDQISSFLPPSVWNLNVVEPLTLPGTSPETNQEVDDGNAQVMMFLM